MRKTTHVVLSLTLPLALLTSVAAHAEGNNSRIVPAACDATFANNGVVDYGQIPASQVKYGQRNTLAVKHLHLQIHCRGNARLALQAVDNRSAHNDADSPLHFGLSPIGSKGGLGSYTLEITSLRADGEAAINLASDNQGKSWHRPGRHLGTSHLLGFTTGNGVTPGSYQVIDGELQVTTTLNKREDIDPDGDMLLDGSTTLELLYL